MPVISRFYGIHIVMYFNDHNPPHLHAMYSGIEARFNFDGVCLEGRLSAHAARLVREWISMHSRELEENWQNASRGFPLKPITPLE